MKKVILIFWPIVFIVLVWLGFSYPYFLQHKVPFPSTYAVNFFPPWSAYHIYEGPVKNNAMPDIITQIYPWKYFTIESWKHGEIPLWNPYSFSGTPHIANYQSAAFSPFNLLFFIFSFVDAWSILILLQPLLAGIFTYLYARSLNLSKGGSVFAALGFMFCGFITTWMDYGTLGYTILFLPLGLFAIEKFLKTQKNWYLILLSFTVPLSFFSGHFQVSLYFLLFILVYIGYYFFKTKNIHTTCYLLLSTLCGLLISMIQILPSLELYNNSLRSGLFQQIEAIPLGYIPTFLVPDFFGNPVTRNDWFGHYAEWNSYIGLLPFMLAFYAVLRKRNRFTLFLLVFSIIAFLLAFATPFLQLLIALHIPVLSTSAASRIIVLFSFCLIILSAFGFDALLQDLQEKKYKVLLSWLSLFILIFIFLWIMVSLHWFLPMDKISIAKQNLKLPTIFFGIGLLIILLHFIKLFQKKIIIIVSIALLFLTAFDMLRFATKWQPFDPKAYVFPGVNVTNKFHPKENYERILGDDGAEVSVYNHLSSTQGYDPLYINRYGEFIGSLDGSLHASNRSVVSFPKDAIYAPNALHLLNIAYILQKNSDNNQPWGFSFTRYPSTQFTPIYNDKSYQVFRNNTVLPHVFLAQNYEIKTKPQKIISSLFTPTMHLNSTVVLEQDPHISQGGVFGNVNITAYSNNKITLIAKTNKDALLFLSEVYYPGWKAYVDGKETSIYRADYTFRSIVVPSGYHTIIFSYEPMSFTIGCWLSIGGIILLLVISFIPKRKLIQ
ncbi:MAG TPA: YfhO family protein [Candidatus Saccharimonadales bacterium]|nr:YfhO family protein [Candidatus Saccharimonadales bacterium]